MEDNDRTVTLNPNLFELGKLRLMLNSSPAEVSGSLPGVSPRGLLCNEPASGFTVVILAMGKSTHERSHQSPIQSCSRKTTTPDSSLTAVPVGSTAQGRVLLKKREAPSLGATSLASPLTVSLLADQNSPLLAGTI